MNEAGSEVGSLVAVAGLQVARRGVLICDVPTLRVAVGERVAVVGPNGAGKTTLLRVLAGLETDVVGRWTVGVPACACVYVHQRPYFFRGTVVSNVAYGLRARGASRREARGLAMAALDRFDLAQAADRSPRGLSAGERRKAAIARALVLEPRVVLLDEPLAALDAPGRIRLIEVLDERPDLTALIALPDAPPVGLAQRIVAIAPPRGAGRTSP